MHHNDGLVEPAAECTLPKRSHSGAAGTHVAPRRRQWAQDIQRNEPPPRLSRFHDTSAPREPLRAADPERLVTLLRDGRLAEVAAEIDARLRSGASPQAVMLEDLAPSARLLGRQWDEDLCDIVDVSLGLGALQHLLHDLLPVDLPPPGAPSIVILLAPGETHALGARVVEGLFRTAGWRTAQSDGDRFVQTLKRDWHDAVGFSLSCERYASALGRAVIAARAASRNPRLKVLVGGAIFAAKPKLAENMGADLCIATAEAAIDISHRLLEDFKQSSSREASLSRMSWPNRRSGRP